MIILTLILVLLCLLTYIRISNNEDLVVANAKDETDLANIKNAKKVYRKAKDVKILLYVALISIAILLICAFSDIDYYLIDYISLDLVNKDDVAFDFNYFFFPAYVLVIREILIQVKIGEFLLKFFKAEEPHLEESPLVSLKSLLYKKPKQPTNQATPNISITNNTSNPSTPLPNQAINNSNNTQPNNIELPTKNNNSNPPTNSPTTNETANSSIDLPEINKKSDSLDLPTPNNNSNLDLPQPNKNIQSEQNK